MSAPRPSRFPQGDCSCIYPGSHNSLCCSILCCAIKPQATGGDHFVTASKTQASSTRSGGDDHWSFRSGEHS